MSDIESEISIEISGREGDPVVVLGSALGADRHMWDEVVPLLDGWRIVRYDHPGHGQSQCLKLEGETATAQAHADAVASALAKVGIEKFHVAGLSLGGMMALWWASHRPQQVLSTTAICAGPVLSPSRAWWDKAALVRKSGTGMIVEETLTRWFTAPFLAANNAAVKRTRETYRACDDEGFAQCCEIIATMDSRPVLDQIASPVGLICAEFDQTLPPDQGARLAAEIQERSNVAVTVEEVAGAAHLVAVEKPQALASALDRVLRHHCENS